MRSLLLIAALCVNLFPAAQISLPYPGPGMPTNGASFVQAANCKGAPGVGNCTTGAISVTSGHTIAFCTGSNGAGTLSSITISTGTNNLASFTQLFTPIASPSSFDCRYILSTNATGSTTFKATWSVTNAMQMVVYELIVPTGLDGTPPAAQANTTNTVMACPSYTTSHAAALVICGVHTTAVEGSSFTASSGFTIPTNGQNVDGSNGGTGAMEYQKGVGISTALSPTITAGATGINYAGTFAFY